VADDVFFKLLLFHLSYFAGHPALLGRHVPFAVDDRAAKRWMEHMLISLDSVPEIDAESKQLIIQFLHHTAYFISAGLEKMRRQADQHQQQMAGTTTAITPSQQ
jgi:truncated hemoglobin YjbI